MEEPPYPAPTEEAPAKVVSAVPKRRKVELSAEEKNKRKILAMKRRVKAEMGTSEFCRRKMLKKYIGVKILSAKI